MDVFNPDISSSIRKFYKYVITNFCREIFFYFNYEGLIVEAQIWHIVYCSLAYRGFLLLKLDDDLQEDI